MRESLIFLFLGLNYTLVGNIIYPSLPGLQEQFKLSALQLSLMASMPALINLIFQPSAGWISDRIDRKVIVLLGLLAYITGGGIAAGLVTFTSGYLWIVVARGVMGIGELGAFPQYLALIKETLPPESHRRTLGWMESITSVGGAIGPSIGGFLVSLSLGLPFLASSLFALAAFVISCIFIPKRSLRQQTVQIDRTRTGMRQTMWMIRNSLLKNPAFLGGFLALGILVTVQTFIGSYVKELFQLGPTAIGFTMACVPIAMAAGSILSAAHGEQGDITNSRFITSGIAGTAGLLFIMSGKNPLLVYSGLFFIGGVIGYWLPYFDHGASASTSTNSGNSGLKLSFFQQSKAMGILLMPTLFGIFNDVSQSLQQAYAFLAILFVILTMVLLVMKQKFQTVSEKTGLVGP